MKGLGSGLSGLSRMKQAPLGEFQTGTKKQQQQIRDALVMDLMRDADVTERQAKQIITLQVQYPLATVIECIVYLFLRRYHYDFRFQAKLPKFKPDFLVRVGGHWAVVNPNGTRWHIGREAREHDTGQRIRALSMRFEGMPIKTFAELWENVILDDARRDQAIRAAILGKDSARV